MESFGHSERAVGGAAAGGAAGAGAGGSDLSTALRRFSVPPPPAAPRSPLDGALPPGVFLGRGSVPRADAVASSPLGLTDLAQAKYICSGNGGAFPFFAPSWPPGAPYPGAPQAAAVRPIALSELLASDAQTGGSAEVGENTTECSTPPKQHKKKARFCKAKRDHYHRLIDELVEQASQSPGTFSLEGVKLPNAIAACPQSKEKLIATVRKYAAIRRKE